MAIEVTMPQMGADMTEGTVVRWLKNVGDEVARGDILAEIETDKATVELEAFEAGVLKKLLVEEGETVPVGETIALLGTADEEVGEDKERMPPAATPPARKVEAEQKEAVAAVRASEGAREAGATEELTQEAAGAKDESEAREPVVAAPAAETPAAGAQSNGRVQEAAGGRLRVSPVARRIANEAGIDVRNLKGSGPDGRILRRDVEAAIKAGGTGQPARQEQAASALESAPEREPASAEPAPARTSPVAARAAETGDGNKVPLSRMRQAIARRMSQSKQQQPHYYLTLDIDMTDALLFRQQLNASATEEQRVSVNDLVVKACALALQRHPKFNAEFVDNSLVVHERINIDIGIALDEGLIAPAVLDCGSKSLGRIAIESKDLINRAKSGRLSAGEYSEGTFTITNLGAYGVETLIGIINPPQAAILGVGSVMPRPVVRDDQVVVRQVMKVALSADHRVTDGAEGARFIKEIQGLLESPASLAL